MPPRRCFNCAKHCPVSHWSAFFPARPAIQGRAAIAAAADSVIVLSSEYCAGCMKRRNRFLVENASMLIAVYDGRRTGGTFQTVGMAARRGLRTVILNPTAKKV